MRVSAYLETSIIGHLASRPSRDVITVANQQTTHEWWQKQRHTYDLYVSQFVITECSAGDALAAKERFVFLKGIPLLDVTVEVEALAALLLKHIPLPQKAAVDAAHIAVSAVHGIDYLLTWNCKHIANASLRHRIETICRSEGYEAPTVCTPQELTEI